MMNELGISKSILSITSPGTHLTPTDHKMAAQITRDTNKEMSEICAKHPDRFGFFAALPLPDVENSLEEIDVALDQLHASGFGVLTNAHGNYLGDRCFDPIFERLNDRHAILFIHPTQCHSLHDPTGSKPLDQYPAPMMEYLFDTTRAITNLLLSGTVKKYPNITFLVSHCGAVLPPLVERFTSFSALIQDGGGGISSAEIKELFKSRFYFDLAGFPFPDLIHGFLRMSDASRLLYGSDYPYTPGVAVAKLSDVMDQGLHELFDEETVKRIYSGNARKLLG